MFGFQKNRTNSDASFAPAASFCTFASRVFMGIALWAVSVFFAVRVGVVMLLPIILSVIVVPLCGQHSTPRVQPIYSRPMP